MRIRNPAFGALCGLLASMTGLAYAQTDADLAGDATHPANVLTYGMGYNAQRYSTVTQINKGNVKKLAPVWALGLENTYGEVGQPVVLDGVMYVADARWTVAIDAVTGKALWRSDVNFDPDFRANACCGVTYRGVALYDGLVLRGTLDGYMVGLDQKTGKQVWRTQVADWKDGYSITSAPLVANGVLITGVAGSDRGVRGMFDGYDPHTGKRLWRLYTTPAPGEQGSESWMVKGAYLHGGGGSWLTGSYDPALDLVYWGTANAAPYNPGARGGDSLYTASVLAFHPRTGEIVWHYQFTPSDMYDYDAVFEMILAELKIDGRDTKALIHFDKNGFLYVFDRTDGKLLAANPYARVNWASKIDLTTGRPVETDLRQQALAGQAITVWPSFQGGRNWPHAAFNPKTGLLYTNTINMGSSYQFADPPRFGSKNHQYRFAEDGGPKGRIEAFDPLTGKAKWSIPLFDYPNGSSMLATASGLLFTGRENRDFVALDAANGQELWHFKVSSGVNASPITWSYKGKQYVSVLAGIGGNTSRWMGDERKTIPDDGAVWTFALPD